MTQAITLRLVTRQAGGGEIVRQRRITTGEALIGRAPECDVHLPDLAVDMQHALLRVTGLNRVLVESLTGHPFLVDGKFTLRADLDMRASPVLGFGDYTLQLGLGADDDIAVTVARRDESAAPTAALFSLRANLFSRRIMAWTLGLVILAFCFVLPFGGRAVLDSYRIHPDRQWSTGPLSKAHAFLEQDCKACHVNAFVAVRDAACLSCHQAGRTAAVEDASDARVNREGSPNLPLLIFDHARAPHGRLVRAMPPPPTLRGQVGGFFETALGHPSGRCASCHREHTTAPPDPTVARTADILRTGKPALVVVSDCAGCHAQLKMWLPDTKLIDTPDWNHHPDFRPQVIKGFNGAAPRLERVALSPRPVEANGLTFSHKIHMDPRGGVAQQGSELGPTKGYGAALTCYSCHRPDGLGGFKPMEMERDCGACHSLAFAQVGGQLKTLRHHDMRDIPGVLAGARVAAGPSTDPAVLRRAMQPPNGLCVVCHTIVSPGATPFGGQIAPVKVAERLLPAGDFNHAVPAHEALGVGAAQCVDCHKATTSTSASDLLLEGIATCRACHGKTEHDTPRFAATNCGECHGYHTPGLAPLTGQDRLFRALGAAPGAKARGLPLF